MLILLIYGSTRDPDKLDTRILGAMIIKGIVHLRISEEKVAAANKSKSPVEWIQVQISGDVESRLEGHCWIGGIIVILCGNHMFLESIM